MTHVMINGRIILAGCFIVNEKKEVLLLFRKNHKHYETPGGKIQPEECADPCHPTQEELKAAALREVKEEIGNDIIVGPLDLLGSIAFTIPDGRKAVANTFITKFILGTPCVNEPEVFSKAEWLPIKTLEQFPLSPNLKVLLPAIKKKFRS